MMEQKDQLIFLGTGTGVPSAEMGSPSQLLKLTGALILVDMGPGTLRQLAQLSIPITEIDFILLTHLHPDHSADLVPFLFASKYPPYLINRSPVHLLAGMDFQNFYQGLKTAYGHWIDLPPDLLKMTFLPEDKPWEEKFPNFSLSSRPILHTSSSLGYRLTIPPGKIIVFSGDSDYSGNVVDLARQADVLVLECSFPEGEKIEGHLTPSLAGRIAREAGVKKLILSHFYPECRGHDLIGPCSREYQGPIILAEDFLSISV
jgi:ribonuclease BN (tRNA processing enzyme)